MAFVIEKKAYPLMPEGQHAVTIQEVKDLGEQDTPFGKKHQLYLQFVNGAGESTRKYYTASVHEKSTLYKDVKSFTGKAPVSPFNADALQGLPLNIIVSHEEGQKGIRAKIVAFLKAAPGQKATVGAKPATVAVPQAAEIQEADIPF